MIASTLPSAPGTPTLIQQSSTIIEFSWTQPYDNGGSEIKEYQIVITNLANNKEIKASVIGSTMFAFDSTQGLVAGNSYSVKIRAYNFYSTFYNMDASCPYSPVATFYASDLPSFIPQLSFTDRTSTDATV